MRIKNILTLFVLAALALQSCDKSEQTVTGIEGGLVEIKNPSINYVVGNPGPYTASVRVYQGEVKTTKVEIYKTFNSTRPDTLVLTKKADGAITKSVLTTVLAANTVLYATINITGDQNSIESYNFTFSELRDGLTIESAIVPTPEVDTSKYSFTIIKGFTNNDVGEALPISDGDYTIGDNWEFTYNATVSDGRVVTQNTPTKVTVATRYAGKYRFVQGVYYRIGVLSDNGSYWDNPYWLFESIDAKTYKMTGVSAWDDQIVYFQIDGTGKITYPATWDGVDQIINDQPLITCESNPTDMTNVCGLPNANTVINDDVNGKDRLIMSFGYYTAGSGPREFYQVMEKIVE
ncbi:MAG: hypothetical protein A2W96_06305 [Bacteroidetes bacterium GWD2_40_43]|nr:MAG: hypothetical protein A2W96_06305 [Bacteroidetes bacterium GWD2_40_43]OFY21924.1 MAG: hypothetical protein A2W88_12320 [Bacteroidetes bacterium GWF2_40_13]